MDSSLEYQLCKYVGMHEDLTVYFPGDGLLMSLDTANPALTVTSVKRSPAHNGQCLALPTFFTI